MNIHGGLILRGKGKDAGDGALGFELPCGQFDLTMDKKPLKHSATFQLVVEASSSHYGLQGFFIRIEEPRETLHQDLVILTFEDDKKNRLDLSLDPEQVRRLHEVVSAVVSVYDGFDKLDAPAKS